MPDSLQKDFQNPTPQSTNCFSSFASLFRFGRIGRLSLLVSPSLPDDACSTVFFDDIRSVLLSP